MRRSTLSILLTVLTAAIFFSCQKVITEDSQLTKFADQTSPLSTRTARTLAPAGISNLTAYITYNPNGLIFVTFNWGGSVPLSFATIIVTEAGQQIGGETIAQITPGASISRTYGTSIPFTNGLVIAVTVTGSDGSSASASATVYISSPLPPGTPPTTTAPGMASTPQLVTHSSLASSTPVTYNITSLLTWNTNYLPMSSPYYNQQIYACIQYEYPSGAAFHYCVTNNLSYEYVGYIRDGHISFPSFIDFPVGIVSTPCSMPTVIAYYYQLSNFIPDTVRSDRFIQTPLIITAP
jgi:hypothetical protein